MKCHLVEARDLPDAWFQLVDLCYRSGRDYRVSEGSYANAQFRRELDFVTVHVRYPYAKPLLPDIPPGLGIPNPVPEGMDYVERYLPYIMTPEKQPGEQYTYGERLMSDNWMSVADYMHGHPDHELKPGTPNTGQKMVCGQVDEIIEKFKRGFGNNQCCMTVAIPTDVHLPDPPCLRMIDTRIFDVSMAVKGELDDTQKLHFFIYFRSWDLWGGFPPNLAALTFLQADMAQQIGVEPGEFVCMSKGLHLYDMYWELARIRLGESDG